MHTSEYIALIEQKLGEAAAIGRPVSSLEEALGHITIALTLFKAELAQLSGNEANPEELLEHLVSLGAAAGIAAEVLLLPVIRRSL